MSYPWPRRQQSAPQRRLWHQPPSPQPQQQQQAGRHRAAPDNTAARFPSGRGGHTDEWQQRRQQHQGPAPPPPQHLAYVFCPPPPPPPPPLQPSSVPGPFHCSPSYYYPYSHGGPSSFQPVQPLEQQQQQPMRMGRGHDHYPGPSWHSPAPPPRRSHPRQHQPHQRPGRRPKEQQWGGDEWPLEQTPAFPEAKGTGEGDPGQNGAAELPPSAEAPSPRNNHYKLRPHPRCYGRLLPRTAIRPEDPQRAAALLESVGRVLETSLHLVAPFLAPADLLRVSGVARGWTRAYRGVVAELRVGEPPPGRRSGHWTGLLTLLATLKNLRALQLAHHAHAVFPLVKCLGFRLTDGLQALDLSHVRICRTDEQRLLAALGDGCTPALASLALVDCGLTDRGAALLAGALRAGGLRRLVELDLSINGICRGALEIGEAVGSGAGGGCPGLRELVLAKNPLGREGVAMLMQGLAASVSAAAAASQPLQLRSLNLVETGLEADGCDALCQGLLLLKETTTTTGADNDGGGGSSSSSGGGALGRLETLLLNANNLGDAGVAALAAALEDGTLPALGELGLGSNYIGDEGVASLVRVILLARGTGTGNTGLRRLNLAFNFVTAEGARALVGALAEAAAAGAEGEGDGDEGAGRSLDLYQNEVRGPPRQELQLEVRALLPGLECTL